MNNTTLPFDPRLRSIFEEFQSNDSWSGKCVYRIYTAAQGGGVVLDAIVAGLIGQDGRAGVVPNLSSSSWARADVWGINIALCNEYCSRQAFPMVFNYQTFLARVTNYLLPWLALTAQLPYEAGGVVPNIISFCMAVGSPMLITFSLMMTILNRRWFENKYRRLSRPYRNTTFATRLDGAHSLLEAAQQVPIRMALRNGWLASLILLPSNEQWWSRLSSHVEATRRSLTLSLVAQSSVAVIAWVLTIIGSFGTALGSHAEGLVLSSSTLWTWLVPVILGWITVGTLSKTDGIEKALQNEGAYLAPTKNEAPNNEAPNHEGPNNEGPNNEEPNKEKSGSTPDDPPDNQEPNEGLNGEQHIQPPRGRFGTLQECFRVARPEDGDNLYVLGLSVNGDELQPGPVYNYARIFTWRLTAERLLSYFEATVDNINNGRNVLQVRQRARQNQAQVQRNPVSQHGHPGFQDPIPDATAEDRELYCDIRGIPDAGEQPVYPTEIGPDLWFHIISAFFIASFVQWGTAGGAIVIAYLTDAKGLGCRSGSYLLYGVLSTIAFFLFFLSGLASRAAVLSRPIHPGGGSVAFSLLRVAAVTTRLLGRLVAAGNAVWIVLSSIWELVGFFDNCWCQGTEFSWGSHAWVALFKNTFELKDHTTGPWAGGVVMSSFVMALSYAAFWLFCHDSG